MAIVRNTAPTRLPIRPTPTTQGSSPAVGVALGLGLYYARTTKKEIALEARIREELAKARSSGGEPLPLPALVRHIGLSDGFFNRGKVMSVLAPMVASGEVLQEEPEGTTTKNRLEVLRFRLR